MERKKLEKKVEKNEEFLSKLQNNILIFILLYVSSVIYHFTTLKFTRLLMFGVSGFLLIFWLVNLFDLVLYNGVFNKKDKDKI